MARMIDADALMRKACGRRCGRFPNECDYDKDDHCVFREYIEAAPTIDTGWHGKWEGVWNPGLKDKPRHCTRCGFNNTRHGCVDFKFCPNCGARMDAEEDDDGFMEYTEKCCGTCHWLKLDENRSPYCSEPRLSAKACNLHQYLLTLIGRCPEGYWEERKADV